jgi:hypothetical protein
MRDPADETWIVPVFVAIRVARSLGVSRVLLLAVGPGARSYSSAMTVAERREVSNRSLV